MYISLTVILCAATFFVEQISCSAIPMWENLTKQEKMSYLYSMFGHQVEKYCEYSQMQNCNQELLTYGLNKLKAIPEEHLDFMDPYQRGSNNMIWDSMMEGHEMMRTVPKAHSTTTPEPNAYDSDLSFDADELTNVYRVPPPKGFVYFTPASKFQYNIKTGQPEYRYPIKHRSQNELSFDDVLKPSYNNDKFDSSFPQEAPLTGPMVIKVYPDGSPLSMHMPQDEDLRQHKLFQAILPNSNV